MFRVLARGKLVVDALVLAIAFTVAAWLRFEGDFPPLMVHRLVAVAPYVVLLEYGFLLMAGVHRLAWRHFSLYDVIRVAAAIGCSTILFGALRIAGVIALGAYPRVVYLMLPMGLVLTNGALAFLGVSALRAIRRLTAEQVARHATGRDKTRIRTILVGAGSAGALVAREISARPDLGIEAVGFVDDDRMKQGTLVHGIPVLGTTHDLAAICERKGATEALVTMASAPGKDVRRIMKICESGGINAKIIPGVFELMNGTINLSRIRKVSVEDLLRREPIVLEMDAIAQLVRDRTVLVTGAGGSIGSEICRQLCRFSPKKLVLVERAENSLFHIERELRELHPGANIVPSIADICDAARIDGIFADHRPHIVFHAAAHKHVPLMEENPVEAVKNNVFGTQLLADRADAHGVNEFVMISTDKAVRPTSVMGATKRAAEIYIQALSQRSRTRFVAVRFGNVLGSNGSVVPIFQQQIAKGGPVTVTDPKMQRYFMTIPEACQLVLQAGAMGKGGEIFVLDMGEPVSILALAEDLIRLSGLRPGEDIEIVFSGMRPGEKLFEELMGDDEQCDRTRHAKIQVGRITPHAWDDVLARYGELTRAVATYDPTAARAGLRHLIPEFVPPSGVPEVSTPFVPVGMRDRAGQEKRRVAEVGPS